MIIEWDKTRMSEKQIETLMNRDLILVLTLWN